MPVEIVRSGVHPIPKTSMPYFNQQDLQRHRAMDNKDERKEITPTPKPDYA